MRRQWEGQREAFEAALREGGEVPDEAVTVAVSLDGVMVPMKDAKRADGTAGYQEAGCATLTYYDAEGERLDTVYWGRMPQPHKEVLKTTLGAALEVVLGKRPDLHVVTIADGARDNWRYLDTLAPQGTAVVDFYHAAEHLKSGLDACYGQGNAKGRAHYEKLRHLLRHDCAGVEKVIRSLNHQTSICAGPIRGTSVSLKCWDTCATTVTAWAMPRRRPAICPLARGWWRRRARRW